jgi:hypothetical protein
MRKVFLIGLLCLAGCRSFVTPLDARRPERADDPLLAAEDQKRRARYLFAFPDELGPQSGVDNAVNLTPHGQ